MLSLPLGDGVGEEVLDLPVAAPVLGGGNLLDLPCERFRKRDGETDFVRSAVVIFLLRHRHRQATTDKQKSIKVIDAVFSRVTDLEHEISRRP